MALFCCGGTTIGALWHYQNLEELSVEGAQKQSAESDTQLGKIAVGRLRYFGYRAIAALKEAAQREDAAGDAARIALREIKEQLERE